MCSEEHDSDWLVCYLRTLRFTAVTFHQLYLDEGVRSSDGGKKMP
jgi:hypothetical protein